MIFNLKTKKFDNPYSYFLLSIVRLSFFLMLSSMYLFINNQTVGWVKVFVIGNMVISVINHFLYYFYSGQPSKILAVAAIDTAVSSAYGYVYLGGDYPDLLFLGLVGLFLFMYIESRAVTIAWSVFIPLNIALQMALELKQYGSIQFVMYFVNGSFVIFASLIGSLIRFYQQSRIQTAYLNTELKKTNQQLIEYASKVETLSINRERIRIAREIHDTVGHNLTALLIQLQVARKLQEGNSMKSTETLIQCEELARDSLQELRLSVRTMREVNQHLTIKESLEHVAGKFAEMTAMQTIIYVDDDLPVLRDSMHLTLSRIVQESLTNAKKHGNASMTWVTLRTIGEQIELSIRDNGKSPLHFVPGFGLLTMRERVQENGGTLYIDSSQQKGFEIRAAFQLQQVIV